MNLLIREISTKVGMVRFLEWALANDPRSEAHPYRQPKRTRREYVGLLLKDIRRWPASRVPMLMARNVGTEFADLEAEYHREAAPPENLPVLPVGGDT